MLPDSACVDEVSLPPMVSACFESVAARPGERFDGEGSSEVDDGCIGVCPPRRRLREHRAEVVARRACLGRRSLPARAFVRNYSRDSGTESLATLLCVRLGDQGAPRTHSCAWNHARQYHQPGRRRYPPLRQRAVVPAKGRRWNRNRPGVQRPGVHLSRGLSRYGTCARLRRLDGVSRSSDRQSRRFGNHTDSPKRRSRAACTHPTLAPAARLTCRAARCGDRALTVHRLSALDLARDLHLARLVGKRDVL